MRKFLPYIFIFIVIFGFFTPTHFAFATDAIITANDGATQAGGANSTADVTGGNAASCGIDVGCWIMRGLANIAYFILTIFAFILWLSGILLEFVLKITIVEMKNNISGMTGIDIVWRTIRDLVNIVFIFILLKEGIQLIISQSDTTKAKNVVVGIVVTAILINFSVFFTKIIIDASNIVTIGFYKSITTEDGSQLTLDPGSIKVPLGISGAYVNALKIQEFWSEKNLTNLDPTGSNTDYKKLTIIGFMGSILFLILSFIFFAISMMLIIRFIVLIFLLVISPLGFLGFGLPSLKSYQTKWWDTLMGQAIFAPLFMILTWINLTLIGNGNFTGVSMNPNTTGLSYNDLFISGNSTNIGLLFNFIVIIGFAVISLTVSKSYSSRGAAQIGKLTSNLTTFAGGVMMGGAAAVGRNTVGAAADRLAQSQRLQNWAGQSALGEKVLKRTRGVASGSFDVRRSAIGEKGASLAGVDLGKGTESIPFLGNANAGQGGFNKKVKDKTSEKESFAQTLSGDQAKRDYAIRQADKWYSRQGSRPNNLLTVAGTMGRSNRITASKLLSGQLTPLQTQRDGINNNLDTQRNNLQNQQNTDTQLNQQLVTLQSELNSLLAIPPAQRDQKDNARINQLQNQNGPITNIQNQITANQTRINNTNNQIANLQAQLGVVDNQINNLNGEIDRLGLNNPANMTQLTPLQQLQNQQAIAAGRQPPHRSRPTRADEQSF